MDEGYQVMHGGKLITVFSAANYVDQMANKGAVVRLDANCSPTFIQVSGRTGTRGRRRRTPCGAVRGVAHDNVGVIHSRGRRPPPIGAHTHVLCPPAVPVPLRRRSRSTPRHRTRPSGR